LTCWMILDRIHIPEFGSYTISKNNPVHGCPVMVRRWISLYVESAKPTSKLMADICPRHPIWTISPYRCGRRAISRFRSGWLMTGMIPAVTKSNRIASAR
jgi:hypothetical protein